MGNQLVVGGNGLGNSRKSRQKCSQCGVRKPLSEFNRNRTRKNGLQTMCKGCSRERSRRYYRENPEKHKKAVYQRNKRIQRDLCERIKALKAGNGCALCDENEPVCLEFHHLDPTKKDVEIGTYVRFYPKWDNLLKEVRKCVVLCCNCHRKVHAGIRHVDESKLCDISKVSWVVGINGDGVVA